jgi:REP element-mobilizing transposase RayT
MKEGYDIRHQTLPHFITATIVDWVDVFSRKTYRDKVIECFDYCIKNKGMILYSYVIMSNHIHMIVQSNESKLSDLLRDFKKFTSKTIIDKIQSEPESRREWMLERFKLATESHSRNKNF